MDEVNVCFNSDDVGNFSVFINFLFLNHAFFQLSFHECRMLWELMICWQLFMFEAMRSMLKFVHDSNVKFVICSLMIFLQILVGTLFLVYNFCSDYCLVSCGWLYIWIEPGVWF